MLFNSIDFLVYFITVTLIYYLTSVSYRWFVLLFASCIFYMYYIPIYIVVLFFIIIVDYCAGIAIDSSKGKHKGKYLVISILVNISVLFFFKYYNFFLDSTVWVIGGRHLPYLDLVLPIGLSFHTFQSISYTVEVYRGRQPVEKHLGIYALYVMYYPQLVAGPIERPQNIIPQLRQGKIFKIDLFWAGVRLAFWGLFKKVVVADRLSIYVDAVFGNVSYYDHPLNIAIAIVFFSFQIYCDFSGYSDIAIGVSRAMGIELMLNFDRPYFSNNIREFWNRWHISLSSWFRDYVYIPLGGNRGRFHYLSLLLVFLISGLWHGAGMNYIVWGGLHGIFVIIYALYSKYLAKYRPLVTHSFCLDTIITFLVVSLLWVFFRATSFTDACIMMRNLFGITNHAIFKSVVFVGRVEFGNYSYVVSFLSIMLVLLYEFQHKVFLSLIKRSAWADVFFSTGLILSIFCFWHF